MSYEDDFCRPILQDLLFKLAFLKKTPLPYPTSFCRVDRKQKDITHKL